MDIANRDGNRVPALLGTSSIDRSTVDIYAHPTAHAMYVMIVAEDVDSPGTYVPVQGKYVDGNFVILTNGTTVASADEQNNFTFQDGNSFVFQDDNNFIFND
jgi:hypothetical protein